MMGESSAVRQCFSVPCKLCESELVRRLLILISSDGFVEGGRNERGSKTRIGRSGSADVSDLLPETLACAHRISGCPLLSATQACGDMLHKHRSAHICVKAILCVFRNNLVWSQAVGIRAASQARFLSDPFESSLRKAETRIEKQQN